MKIPYDQLANFAWARLDDLSTNESLASPRPDLDDVLEAEFSLAILRAIAEGKKRLTIDIVYPTSATSSHVRIGG